MKKLTVFLSLLVLLSASVFAKGTYSGDIQLHEGISVDVFSANNNNTKLEAVSGLLDIDVQTCHLFSVNDFFSVGFMANLNAGAGLAFGIMSDGKDLYSKTSMAEAITLNTLIGPSVGLTFGKVCRLNFSTGLAVNWLDVYLVKVGSNDKFAYSTSGLGGYVDVNAKFLPKGVVSPLVGFNCVFTGSKNYQTMLYSTKTTTTIPSDSISVTKVEMYAGISFNW